MGQEKDKEPTTGVDGAAASAEAGANQVMDAIKKARDKRGPVDEKQKLIEEAMAKSEVSDIRKAMGLDIPFDVKTLLTKGMVEKRGLKISDELFIDMHTLTKTEDILAERLVEEFNGPMPLSKAYLEAKLVAVLVMAITRVNRERFPTPDLDPMQRNTDGWKTDWDLKRGLMRALMAMQPNDIDALGLVYTNLDKMDVLIEEEARPKSSRP